ncbi:hypothetical protein H6P81_020172 [Aristolochia fimbriata]|uniref:OTU domain-containing protein n=1 Tax=Aristolochia fimbriata TaxID=158543 RepID=A0AAV7DXR2_ARIFI|nr:hypothetical protein H6P81_020172 [Aristolochia fimbriata]
MVQAKHKKSIPKQQPTVRRRGRQTKLDQDQFRVQLDALGLKIVQVTADGNCFFRALADQLEGNEEEHAKYRLMVVQHFKMHREEFEPFIEDEVPFDEYCKSMEQDGTWAGNMELQAASLVTHSNICIHRAMSPRWYIQNFDKHGTHMIHLSYHDDEHYNSIRHKDDDGSGPAKTVVIKADANLSAKQMQSTVTQSRGCTGKRAFDAGSIKIVMSGTGCFDASKVEEVLHELNGDIDAAVEYLIQEQGTDLSIQELDDKCQKCVTDDSHEIENCELVDSKSKSLEDCKGCYSSLPLDRLDTKRIPRNKLCPCGSKKKYKACCGSARVKSSTDSATTEEFNSRKPKVRAKQASRRDEEVSAATSSKFEGTPDMGALCI